MKKQGKEYRLVLAVALATGLLLMVPLIAMQFTAEVSWRPADFLAMGALVFTTGLALVFLIRKGPNTLYRIATSLALCTTFLMIWANLAVGLIGSGPNAANLMYAGVVPLVIAGSVLSRFKARGMECTMYAASGALAGLAIIAFLAGAHRYPGSSVAEIFGVSGFFAGLYLIAGLLFRYAAKGIRLKQVQGGI